MAEQQDDAENSILYQREEKLAESLQALHRLQKRRVVAIRSADLSRTHRERLLNGGFLKGVMKGWYISSHPDEAPGDSTAWYAAFWDFCASYLSSRFDEQGCLSPEQSSPFRIDITRKTLPATATPNGTDGSLARA